MIPYILLVIFYLVLSLIEFNSNVKKLKNNNKINWLYSIFLVFPIWFLISFRGLSVGCDTEMYEYLFEQFTSESLIISFVVHRLEKGFIFYCWLLGYLNLDFHAFLLITASITCFSFVVFFKRYSRNYAFSWFLFITLLFLPRSMNICREILAVSLALFTYKWLLEKKWIKYVVGAIFLTLIHKSAILLLLVLFLLKVRNPFLRMVLVVGMCLSLAFVFEPLMETFVSFSEGKYDYLEGGKYTETEGGIAKYVNIIFALYAYIALVSVPKIKDRYKHDVWKCIALCAVILNFAGLNFGMADRASLYYVAAFLLFIPNYLMSTKVVQRPIYFTVTASLFTAYFFTVMILRNNWHAIVPYEFWWN